MRKKESSLMLSVAEKQMASETARAISNNEEKDLPTEFQRGASKLVCCSFVRHLCHGSGLSLRIMETQCLKKAEFIIFSTSFSEFRMEIPLQPHMKQSAALVKYHINHNTSIFSMKQIISHTKPSREFFACERLITFVQLQTVAQTLSFMLMSLQFR